MSLIKNKSNEEMWGTVKRFRGNLETARYRTRVGYIINQRIDDWCMLLIAPKWSGVARVPSRNFLCERDYYEEKKRAFSTLHRIGELPSRTFIMERCITFEGGKRMITRENREYRMSDKPIGK